MNKDIPVSDEHLNAYIDDQLDIQEQSNLLNALRQDKALRRRNCELQKIHDLVKLTYSAEPAARRNPSDNPPRKRVSRTALVAGVTLVFGLLTGWLSHQFLPSPAQPPTLLQLANTVHNGAPAAQEQEWRVLLHISKNDPFRFMILLDETEKLLNASLAQGSKLQVEILANSDGLQLLKNADTVYAQRLKLLQQQHRNLMVSACNQALTRLKREKGIELELLPNTRIVPSAIGEVLKRHKQGWTYIRI